MTIPAELLRQISQLESGRVVLIIGAGCSNEPPTNLPLSRALASDTHRKLVDDGILELGDCTEPDNLSCVADVVWAKKGSQRELVKRLPIPSFLQAEPNKGHLLAAALLYERALGCILTLNFDLAMSTALSYIGAQGKVTVIRKPEDHSNLGLVNLIYLHRNAEEENPDNWVLRSITLGESWSKGWERVVAEKVLCVPVTVFIGLGSSVGVLEECTIRIMDVLRGVVEVYQVDPGPREDSLLFTRLGLPYSAYLQMTWSDFMHALADRVTREHRADLDQVCKEQVEVHNWDDENTQDLCTRITQGGLIKLGQIRARWTLNSPRYSPKRDVLTEWIADLLITVGFIERIGDCEAVFRDDGIIEFRRDHSIIGIVLAAHGRGHLPWSAIEQKIKLSQQFIDYDYTGTIRAIVAGNSGEIPTNITPPENILWQGTPDSLVPVNQKCLMMYDIERLHENPELVQEILS